MERTTVSGESAPKTKKKVVDRSAAYPSITIEKAIEFCRSIAKSFPKEGTVVTRQDIAAVLKTSPASIQRDVATAAQYGLFDKQKDGYSLTAGCLAILTPLSEIEKRKNIVQCFTKPKLYRALVEKFDNHAIPTELPYHLIRDHEISERAAPDAAAIFIANGVYCGVINDSNLLRVGEMLSQLVSGDFQDFEVVEEKPAHETGVLKINSNESKQLPAKPEPGQDRERIKLSDSREAYLTYPTDLTKRDIEIIRKYLDIFEFRLDP